ncbi:uncharacterized protein LOC119458977 [Dermacentor silvarum]|uniref:uncharacterized protein LOC119458977 n=1 Tax=Dermacentor silvarum TaxID=543639 RepID=UPI00189A9B6B|nr:uncharacterized protein LOC119458977 [Dermacentor silvarum]
MATLTRALAVLLTLHLCTAETPFSVSIGPCPGIPQVDWTERINAYLRGIPNNLTLPEFLQGNEAMGMDIGSPTLTGLGDLWAYKPYSSACFAQTTTYVEVIAFARVPLVATVSWKGCTGGSGHMGIQVSSSQLRLVFKVTPTSDDPTHLELSRIYPVSLEDAEMFISGAPKAITRMVHYTSVIMKHQIEQFWSFLLRMDAQFLIRGQRPRA